MQLEEEYKRRPIIIRDDTQLQLRTRNAALDDSNNRRQPEKALQNVLANVAHNVNVLGREKVIKQLLEARVAGELADRERLPLLVHSFNPPLGFATAFQEARYFWVPLQVFGQQISIPVPPVGAQRAIDFISHDFLHTSETALCGHFATFFERGLDFCKINFAVVERSKVAWLSRHRLNVLVVVKALVVRAHAGRRNFAAHV